MGKSLNAITLVVYKMSHNFWFCGMVFGVGQLNYASQIWLKQTLVATVTKICDFNTKSAIT